MSDPTLQQVRTCSECSAPFESVYRQARTCGKACSATRERRLSRERTAQWMTANKERHDAYLRKYRRENAAKRNAAQKAYRDSNPGCYEASGLAYRARNAEAIREYKRAWYLENLEVAKLNAKLRKGRLRSAAHFEVSTRDLQCLMVRTSGLCSYCRLPAGSSPHFDHVIPVVRGGAHAIGNLVLACASCNLSKGSKTVMEWRMWKIRNGLV